MLRLYNAMHDNPTMTPDTIATILTAALGAALGAAITAISVVASLKTDVHWLKTRLSEIGRQIEAIQAQTRNT